MFCGHTCEIQTGTANCTGTATWWPHRSLGTPYDSSEGGKRVSKHLGRRAWWKPWPAKTLPVGGMEYRYCRCVPTQGCSTGAWYEPWGSLEPGRMHVGGAQVQGTSEPAGCMVSGNLRALLAVRKWSIKRARPQRGTCCLCCQTDRGN